MQNGLLEPGPFMTIRVCSRNGNYPDPIDFMDVRDEDYGKILSFVHAECGGEVEVEAVRTSTPDNHHFFLKCTVCGTSIKMYDNVFRGDVSSLGVHHEKWVAGAYQFVLTSLV